MFALNTFAFKWLLLCTVSAFFAAASAATSWKAEFEPKNLTMHMKTLAEVHLEIKDIDTKTNFEFRLQSQDKHIATVEKVITANDVNLAQGTWSGNVSITANFLGATQIYVEHINLLTNSVERQNKTNQLHLIVMRPTRIIDHVFVGSVALLVSLLYINFGAAMDLSVLRGIMTHPIGPAIGFISQFVFMPLLSYFIGWLIFPNSVEMQLGMFFTGVSPSGGASNMWAVILAGNMNLSLLMTTISNVAAFGMMPLWLFTLGATIFERGNLVVPYTNIATFAVSLIVPLAIGFSIQKWLPRFARILVRLLKPISTCLIIFIVVFAIITNLYIFELFSWQIVIAGLALPWLGYLFGYAFAMVFRQNSIDALTIAIETGIQNTGIAIFLLRFSLDQPAADITTVIPVSVAIMTPFPLLGLYIYKRCAAARIAKKQTPEQQQIVDNADAPQQQYS